MQAKDGARNYRYTEALLRHLLVSGRQVEDSMKQVTVETILKRSSDRGAILDWRTMYPSPLRINEQEPSIYLSIYLSTECTNHIQ